MSVRVDAANFFHYRALWTGSAYPDPGLPSTAGGFSACGLAIRTSSAGVSFEPILAMSGRFNGGGYFFTGWRNSLDIYGDAGGGLSDVGPEPALNTWFQWAVRADPSGGGLVFYWKYYGDAAWTASLSGATYATQAALMQLFLGTDEWGTGSGGKVALANIRVWFKLKTAADLLTEVNSTTLVDAVNNFAWWKLRADGLTHDSSGNGRDLIMVGAPDTTGLPANSLEAPGDGVGATGVVTGVERTTAVAAISAKGSGRVVVAGIEHSTSVAALTAKGGARATQSGSFAASSVGVFAAKSGAKAPVTGAQGTSAAGNVSAHVDIRGIVPGVDVLSAVGALVARGGARGVLFGIDAFSSIGFVSPITPVVEVPDTDLGLGLDDSNEFGRPMVFSGGPTGARGFAQLTAGSKMFGSKSKIRKRGR
jgi:hypothetical protein